LISENVGILWPFVLFYGQMVYFMVIGYILLSFNIFSHFGLYREKSGNPNNSAQTLSVARGERITGPLELAAAHGQVLDDVTHCVAPARHLRAGFF
jgi:hypothetical protein